MFRKSGVSLSELFRQWRSMLCFLRTMKPGFNETKFLKPIIVFVTGAWHSSSHYGEFFLELQKLQMEIICLPSPSLNPRRPREVDVIQDAAFISRRLLTPTIEQGKEVLLAMHSYGGSPGSVAANGLSKSERQTAGKAGGIIGLVMIAGLIVDEVISLLRAIGGEWPHFMVPNEETGLVTTKDTRKMFYSDVSDSIASNVVDRLRPHSMHALTSPSPSPAWKTPAFDKRRVFIRCTEDKALLVDAQDAMMVASGVDWTIKDLAAGHCPFLSRPSELAQCLIGLVDDIGATYTIV